MGTSGAGILLRGEDVDGDLAVCIAGWRLCLTRPTKFGGSETQKGHPFGWPLYLFDAWQFPTLTWGDPTLPSALRRFTSEFGMGSGGTTALKPPGKFC